MTDDGNLEGLQEWLTVDGIYVLRIHYTADEAKRDPAWKARESKGLTAAQWEQEYEINFMLGGSDIEIRMQVELTHVASKKLGFYCHHIDIDSATHLKRMIELNIGEEQLLYRELEQLLQEHREHIPPTAP